MRENGIAQDQILEMNFESMSFPDMDVRGFHEYVKARILPERRIFSIADSILLRKIIVFLADNIGNNVSATSISNTLVNEGLLEEKGRRKPAVHTIQSYIEALLEVYIFYEIKRFDIKGKEYLRTLDFFFS